MSQFGICEHEDIVGRDEYTAQVQKLPCGKLTVFHYLEHGWRCPAHRPLVQVGVQHNKGSNRKQRRAATSKAKKKS